MKKYTLLCLVALLFSTAATFSAWRCKKAGLFGRPSIDSTPTKEIAEKICGKNNIEEVGKPEKVDASKPWSCKEARLFGKPKVATREAAERLCGKNNVVNLEEKTGRLSPAAIIPAPVAPPAPGVKSAPKPTPRRPVVAPGRPVVHPYRPVGVPRKPGILPRHFGRGGLPPRVYYPQAPRQPQVVQRPVQAPRVPQPQAAAAPAPAVAQEAPNTP